MYCVLLKASSENVSLDTELSANKGDLSVTSERECPTTSTDDPADFSCHTSVSSNQCAVRTCEVVEPDSQFQSVLAQATLGEDDSITEQINIPSGSKDGPAKQTPVVMCEESESRLWRDDIFMNMHNMNQTALPDTSGRYLNMKLVSNNCE